jgi:hypothetical protein
MNMEQTYLCKFDLQGRRTETLLSCDFNEEQKAEKIAEGYIEISEEDWNYYVGNNGNGANGTGYIRGADGKPVDAPAYVPSKEEKLAALDSQYDADKAELTKYYTDALLADDTETQEELKAELQELDADYAEQRKAIEEED